MEPDGCLDSSLPGECPSSAVTQALSQILHHLTCQESRRNKARNAALDDLRVLIDSTECARLCGGDDPSSSPPVPAVLGQVAKALEKLASPPKEQEGRSDRHSGVAQKATEVGALFLQQLGKIEAAKNSFCPAWKTGLRHLAGPVYIFAVTHTLEQPWTNQRSREVAGKVLALLLKVSECGSVAGFLHGENEDEKGSFSLIMGLLKPDMNKESWKNNPATKYVFSWTLKQVTRPWLNQYLERVFPPSLLISDDYQTENKILGVHCLHHIVLNVAVLLCLLDLFPILEKDLHWKGGIARPTTHCEEVLQLVLTHMEPEHRLLLRRTYARNLPAFVKRLGILTIRHLKRLERVIIGYLEVYDGPEEEARLKIMETLKLLLQYAWPRVSCRLVVLLKALLKLVCDVARDSSLTPELVKSSLLDEATDCLILLDHCSQGQVKSLLAKIPQSCDDSKVVKCISKVQQASKETSYAET
ncbi:TELO2-interacting protein 2 isoform X2 [Erinaceus europaeus]|uniref:TELO2-interacting protein 2 isoform X2 n=1 Tax=Erinaceus europaeus TaxID=9365 RepID=A0ABM3WQI6_ERIEU|nr:TELO2-interacting protein 2 isoform X2 [Erinaceus europaeus]